VGSIPAAAQGKGLTDGGTISLHFSASGGSEKKSEMNSGPARIARRHSVAGRTGKWPPQSSEWQTPVPSPSHNPVEVYVTRKGEIATGRDCHLATHRIWQTRSRPPTPSSRSVSAASIFSARREFRWCLHTIARFSLSSYVDLGVPSRGLTEAADIHPPVLHGRPQPLLLPELRLS
jgi:hypothetical protein